MRHARSNSPFRSAIAGATALSLLLATMVGSTAVASDVNIDPLTLGNGGISICGGPNQAECTLEHATYLRPWDSNSNCPSGTFYDSVVYGGSCWRCPPGYEQTFLTKVTDPDACTQLSYRVYEYATWQAQRDTLFGCPTGTFWDLYNTQDNQNDGACYTCDPMVVGNETVTMTRYTPGIWASDACWGITSIQTAPATLAQLDGCVSNTPGKDFPDGNPVHDFTDYNGNPNDSSSRLVGNGTCWTCPPFSDRTVFPVWESDACDTVFKWQSPNYPEPGLFAFNGATDIMAEMLEHPQDMTDAIYLVAAQLGIAPNNIAAYAQSAWNEIGNTPARSQVLNALVLLRLMENVGVYSALPADSAEKALIDDVALYVKNRRTFVAKDALHMYDVWKAGDDYWRQNHPNQILSAFFIGNAPPDFLRQSEDNWMALGATSLASFGSGGAMAAAEVIEANFPNPTKPLVIISRGYKPNISSIPRPQYADATADMADVFDSASLVEAGATEAEAAIVVGSAMAGATIIAAVGAALLSISIDQFVKSQVARPQLVDSLAAAQQNVDLSHFAQTQAFGTYWALGTTQPSDPSAVPLIEDQCQGFVTTPGPDILMAPCLGYIKVARAARTALMTASSQNYQPSFAAPPTISFTAPTSNPFYSKTDVQLTARAADPFGVSSLDCTDGGLPLSLSPTPGNGGNTLDGTTILSGTNEGTHTIACGATDKYGFTTPASSRRSTSVVIDKTPPVLAASYTPPPNADGWNRSDVSVSFGCTDSVSGVATNTAAPAQLVTTEGTTQLSSNSTGSCTDNAGNVALAANATVMLDKTAPTISGSQAPLPNAAGWNNTPVTVTFDCADALSGIASCSGVTNLTSNGANINVLGSAVDKAGNTNGKTVGPVNIDLVPPLISATPSVAANGNGWNSTDVTFTFHCSDHISGVLSCPSSRTFGEGATQPVAGTAYDVAGNSASLSGLAVSIDKTAPAISGARNPAQGNAYGWNNTNVTVTFSCGDSLSGVDPNGGCTPPRIVGEGANQSVAGTASDRAGNQATATVASIYVDKTPPVVTVTGVSDSAVYVRGQVPTAGCNTTDPLSGVLTNATIAVTGGTAHSVGFYQARCSGASDKAGNPRNVVAGYQVTYPFTPFGRPVSTPPAFTPRNAGAAAPLKFGLGGNYGLNVLASSPTSRQVSCTTAAAIGAAAATAGTLTYDTTSQQYTYTWNTDKTWRGTCRQFTLVLDDGTPHPVLFSF